MSDIALEQVKRLIEQLSPSEKSQLLKWLNSSQESEQPGSTSNPPRRSLRGLWADLGPGPSDEDIEEVRREMWRNFPRDDF